MGRGHYAPLRTSDPVADAERWASREDKRPIRGFCQICKKPVYGENDSYDADYAYLFDDGIVCDACINTYIAERRIR
jgi:hypothetical protein